MKLARESIDSRSTLEERGHWSIDASFVKLKKKNPLIASPFTMPIQRSFGNCSSLYLAVSRVQFATIRENLLGWHESFVGRTGRKF